MAFTFYAPPKLSPEEVSPFGNLIQNLMKNYAGGQQIQKTAAELPYAGEIARATAAYKSAMANYLSNPYQMQRFMTPLGKAFNEQQMIGGGYGDESNISPDQQEKYDAYGREIQKVTTDQQQRNNALNAQNLNKQVQDIDIPPLQNYSGAKGRSKLLLDKISSAFGGEPSKEFYEYQNFQKVQKPLIIDQIRKALSTSVVPGYVKENLYPLANPESDIWSNPALVAKQMEAFKKWSKNYAKEVTAPLKKGVPNKVEDNEQNNISEYELKPDGNYGLVELGK